MASEEEKLLEYIKGEQNVIEERPDFNATNFIDNAEPSEYKISDIMSEYSENNVTENFNFNEIVPFIIKTFKNIYYDILSGNGLGSFIKEDRIIGILLLFSFIGIYYSFKFLKTKMLNKP